MGKLMGQGVKGAGVNGVVPATVKSGDTLFAPGQPEMSPAHGRFVWLKDEAAVSRAHFWLTGREQRIPAFYCRRNHTIYTCALDPLPHEFAHAVLAQQGGHAHLSRRHQEALAQMVE